MFQNLLGLQQTSDVPQLALVAEGSALIVFIFLSQVIMRLLSIEFSLSGIVVNVSKEQIANSSR